MPAGSLQQWIARAMVALLMLLVAAAGWGARELYADVRQQRRSIDALDRRLIRREELAFTATDVQRLSTCVTTLAVQVAELGEDIDRLTTEVTSMRSDHQQLREAMIRARLIAP